MFSTCFCIFQALLLFDNDLSNLKGGGDLKDLLNLRVRYDNHNDLCQFVIFF